MLIVWYNKLKDLYTMPNLEDVKKFNLLVSQIESVLTSLNKLKDFSIEELYDRLAKIRQAFTKYKSLAKSTYNGEFSPTLRKKFDKLQEWKENADRLVLEENRLKGNKNVAMEMEEVDKYKDYIEKIEYFLEQFPERLSTLHKELSEQIKFSELLTKNLSKLQLEESDLPHPDLLKAEDEEMKVVSPIKTLKLAKATIHEFARMIKKCQTMMQEIKSLSLDQSTHPLETILGAINNKNLLIKNLLLKLSELNKLIYQANFTNNLMIRQKYNEILAQALTYLPKELASKFVVNIPQSSSKMQELIDSSIGGMKEKMRMDKEQGIDTFVSPWQKLAPPAPSIPIKPISKEIETQNPSSKYEEYIKKNKISPSEKLRYEAEWER